MSDQQTNTIQTQNATTVQPSAQQSVPQDRTPVSGGTSEKNKRQQQNDNKIYSIVAVILFVLIVGELVYVFLFHNISFKQLLSFQSNNSKNTIPSSLTPTVTKVPSDIIIPIPTGQQDIDGTGAASGFTVHLEKVVEKPTVTGDKPNKNLEYIEFDVAMMNSTNTTALTPGMFYFQDARTGKLFMPANTFGRVPAYNWIVPTFSQKRVTIPGKNSVMTTEIPGGKTVNNLSLIYQILPAEKGKLVWDTADTITEIKFGQTGSPTKIINYYLQDKIFELNTTNNENNRIEVFSFP